MVKAHGVHDRPVRAGPVLPELVPWKLSKVPEALAAAQSPEAVWKALREMGLPKKVPSVVHSIL